MNGSGIVIHDYDKSHADRLNGLDTSFTTHHVYRAAEIEGSLRLDCVPLDAPRRKRFVLGDTPSWTRGSVAMDGAAVRGFIATRIETWNRRLVICHFYVDAPYRRRGTGRLLMEEAIRYGRLCGARTVWVETSNVNQPGVEVYGRLGFSICGFDQTLYIGTPAEGEFAIFLARPLDE